VVGKTWLLVHKWRSGVVVGLPIVFIQSREKTTEISHIHLKVSSCVYCEDLL
jgi:hypothetical protein